VLCHDWFAIAPAFVPQGPSLEAMTAAHDAALLIGDPALFAEYRKLGLEKIDLGQAWKDFTGLPFVYACWVGRAGALGAVDVMALQRARGDGASRPEAVAAAFFPDEPERAAIGGAYLRDNIRFRLGEREQAGLERFFALAAEVGVVPRNQPLRWFP
jgi:chorismate dehydratase